MNRRDALTGLGLGVFGAMAGRGFPLGLPRSRAFSTAFDADVELSLGAAPGEVQVRPGERTRVWRYTGVVLNGPQSSLQELPGSWLGPVIRVRRGQNVRIRFRNDLPEPSIVHWHGLDVPEAADGHPRFAIAPGAEYVYEFTVINRAGTYWYHPHPHGNTGSQVYWGLAGLLVVTDENEESLALPSGAEDLFCVLQDRNFDAQNQLAYVSGGMMDRMHGLLGNRMLVNGVENASLSLAARAYRMRVLNGSSSRVFKLAWSDGTPMTVIGSDGGLLDHAVEQAFVTLAPSQRADVILDLSKRATGASVQLRSAPFTASDVSIDEAGMMGGGMGGMRGMGGRMGGMGMAGSAVPNGAPLLLMTLNVVKKVASTFRMPSKLSEYGPAWAEDVAAPVRRVAIDFRAGQWLLGGRRFDMMDAAPDEIVRAGSTQVWEIVNVGGMMGQQMAHPFHVHGTQFRVLSRSRTNGTAAPAPSIREGIIDAGWRDTVLVLPHETVRLQMKVTSYPGLYLYHCHILEHEDMGMMRNFRVVA